MKPRAVIADELKTQVLIRDRNICQMCGKSPQDYDPYTRRKAKITIGFHTALEHGGKLLANNIRAVCSSCAEGVEALQNTALPKPDRIHLLAQVRRATIDDQEAVLNWLLGKFGKVAIKKT